MDDTISRQAAVDAIHEDADWLAAQGSDWQVERMERDKSILKSLPPVQTERIKGHWIEITSINHTYKCSVCGRLLVNITDGKNNVAKNYPYCHCGADMRGEADGRF